MDLEIAHCNPFGSFNFSFLVENSFLVHECHSTRASPSPFFSFYSFCAACQATNLRSEFLQFAAEVKTACAVLRDSQCKLENFHNFKKHGKQIILQNLRVRCRFETRWTRVLPLKSLSLLTTCSVLVLSVLGSKKQRCLYSLFCGHWHGAAQCMLKNVMY